ncbi:MAG: Rieske 2Fe-2S domain-containing protein [Candidatus Eisenbacteria bacterium]|nr:Rieske 2Fe-2S domain-containing protein [Candidatus Eisenbacteria bacterium]
MAADGGSDKGISRRSFLDVALGGAGLAWLGAVLYPVFEYFKVPAQGEAEPTTVVAASFKSLKPNEGRVFRFGSEPAILVLTSEGKLKAFSAACTHLGCTVQYRPDVQRIWCACHNGMYDLNGRNIAGPPPRPLDEYKVALKGDDVVVSKA